MIISIILSFTAGACAGSFLNAAAMRTVADRKWWGSERSVCDSCGHVLCSLDLAPVFSYLLLRGKCRYCKASIKPRHFAAEVAVGALSAALFWGWGFSAAFGMSILVAWFSLFNSLTDFENGYIYDAWAIAPGVIGLLMRIPAGTQAVISGLLGAALGFGVIALIILVSRGGMGWGDAMLMAGIGGAVGWKFCAFGLYAGFLIGGVTVVPLIFIKKLKRKDAVPLGPFLAAGSTVILFTGSALVSRFGEFIGSDPGWPW
ncbi:MAG: prepilin peptidase [Synergistaceae bacterium]|nr:prepilin peptidase [Synergistaceae bacterium]